MADDDFVGDSGADFGDDSGDDFSDADVGTGNDDNDDAAADRVFPPDFPFPTQDWIPGPTGPPRGGARRSGGAGTGGAGARAGATGGGGVAGFGGDDDNDEGDDGDALGNNGEFGGATFGGEGDDDDNASDGDGRDDGNDGDDNNNEDNAGGNDGDDGAESGEEPPSELRGEGEDDEEGEEDPDRDFSLGLGDSGRDVFEPVAVPGRAASDVLTPNAGEGADAGIVVLPPVPGEALFVPLASAPPSLLAAGNAAGVGGGLGGEDCRDAACSINLPRDEFRFPATVPVDLVCSTVVESWRPGATAFLPRGVGPNRAGIAPLTRTGDGAVELDEWDEVIPGYAASPVQARRIATRQTDGIDPPSPAPGIVSASSPSKRRFGDGAQETATPE